MPVSRWMNCQSVSVGGITGFGAINFTHSKEGDEVSDATDNETHLSFAGVQNQVDRITINVRHVQKIVQSVGVGNHAAFSAVVVGTGGGSNLTLSATSTNTVVLAPGEAIAAPRAELANGSINLVVLNDGLSVA